MLRHALIGTMVLWVGCATEREFTNVDSGVVSGGSTRDAAAGGGALDGATNDDGANGEADELTAEIGAPGTRDGGDGAELVGNEDGGPTLAVRTCTDDGDCDDENACNGSERCRAGSCSSGELAENGTQCESADGSFNICRDGNCLTSRCGDGIVVASLGEECDDANGASGDGCNQDCTYGCVEDEQCNDSNICNGDETCDVVSHTCVPGVSVDDDTPCGAEYACNDGRCISVKCGDGKVDSGEECDDGNLDLGDGCDADCAHECDADVDCDDGSVCNGQETCDAETHVCHPGVSLDCDDANACTEQSCDPIQGCVLSLIDGDGDGQASTSIGECGTDCDDGDKSVFAGAGELCDQIDNNCDGYTDEVAPLWYPDCDGDGFAPAGATGIAQCAIPASSPDGCSKGLVGTWTSRPPAEGADCWDSDPAAYPRSDAAWSSTPMSGRRELRFDFNCSEVEEPRWTNTGVATNASCSGFVVAEPVAEASSLLQLAIAPVLCGGPAGWVERTAPSCGNPGTYTYCSGCSRKVEEGYVQECQ